MKITPLDIRQKTFEKVFRGYDKDEVQAFLNSLSHEWERILDEYKELKIRLDSKEKEVEKLREVESSLYKTLKTAEDTGANLIDQANKTAEIRMQETQFKSEKMIQEAKNKAKRIVDEAETSRKEVIDEMLDGLKKLKDDYKRIENIKDDLLIELKNFSSDTLEKVEKFRRQERFDVDEQIMKAKNYARSIETNSSESSELKEDVPEEYEEKQENRQENESVSPEDSEKKEGSNRSFFDEID